MELQLQSNSRIFVERDIPVGRVLVSVTPDIDQDYWILRVPVSDTQAVVAFPKFGIIGVGYQVEEGSWNTNLPWCVPAQVILDHIAVNKGDEKIPDERCLQAIRLLQRALLELGYEPYEERFGPLGLD